MRVAHTQLIGHKHGVASTHIGVCRKENLPTLILEGKNVG